MHPRERVLGMARFYKKRGIPIPLDLLAEASEMGLMLTEFDQPKVETQDHEGEDKHGKPQL